MRTLQLLLNAYFWSGALVIVVGVSLYVIKEFFRLMIDEMKENAG